MMKYYCNSDASRPVVIGDKTIKFEPAEHFAPTNSWWGIHESSDENEVAGLDELAAKGKIEELTEEQFQRLVIKKKQLPPGWPHFKISQPPLQPPAPLAAAPVEKVVVERIDDVLDVKPVAKSVKAPRIALK